MAADHTPRERGWVFPAKTLPSCSSSRALSEQCAQAGKFAGVLDDATARPPIKQRLYDRNLPSSCMHERVEPPIRSRDAIRRIRRVRSICSSFGALGVTMLLSASPVPAFADTGITLPPWVCAQPDAIFVSGFENGETAVPHHPSLGNGGLYPGDQTRTVTVPGYGSHDYFLHVPSAYVPTRAWPLVVALAGAARSMAAALTVRKPMETGREKRRGPALPGLK